jgi:uncharacterized membrane protein
MTMLIAAATVFVLIHLLISGTRVRDAITGAIGEGPYMGLFSLASIAALVWLAMAFGGARFSTANDVIWTVSPETRWIQLFVQLLAMLLIVPGITTPNPTSVRQEATLERPDVVHGMLRVTRHPFLWGVAVWAAGHLLVNGDIASLILFGSLLVLALFGTVSIDAKRRRRLGKSWDAFAAQTSNLPFAAIAAQRQRLDVAEIGWWRIGLAILVWVVLAVAHPYLIGVPGLP